MENLVLIIEIKEDSVVGFDISKSETVEVDATPDQLTLFIEAQRVVDNSISEDEPDNDLFVSAKDFYGYEDNEIDGLPL